MRPISTVRWLAELDGEALAAEAELDEEAELPELAALITPP